MIFATYYSFALFGCFLTALVLTGMSLPIGLNLNSPRKVLVRKLLPFAFVACSVFVTILLIAGAEKEQAEAELLTADEIRHLQSVSNGRPAVTYSTFSSITATLLGEKATYGIDCKNVASRGSNVWDIIGPITFSGFTIANSRIGPRSINVGGADLAEAISRKCLAITFAP